MKLEVGMCVRTKYGISKIENISPNEYDKEYDYVELENSIFDGLDTQGFFTTDEILKASHNIIDLIEVGDYVNGYKVQEVLEYEDNTRAIVIGDDNKSIIWEESSQYIKSIVTKEQFENMEYKVGE